MTSSVSAALALAAELLLSSSSEGAVEVVVTLLKHTPDEAAHGRDEQTSCSRGAFHNKRPIWCVDSREIDGGSAGGRCGLNE